MSLDHLLLWLSAKGAGSWPQFRAAVEEFHIEQDSSASDDPDATDRSDSDLPVYHEVRFALQRLGHVEFRAGEAEHAWRVVPPSLAFLPGTAARGLLCGARSAALLDRLDGVAEVDVLALEGMPQRVMLSGESEYAIATRARALGLHIQEAAPMAILCAIPNVREVATWPPEPMPEMPGWVVHQFSPLQLQWNAVSQEEATRASAGLFRFVMGHQRFYYLCKRGRSYKVPVQAGKYAVMGKRQAALSYDAAHRILSVPAICRPPLLIERALVLCSGVLPGFETSSSRIQYAEVPPSVARLAAQLLCQELQ